MAHMQNNEPLLPSDVIEQIRQDALDEGMDPDAAVAAAETAISEQEE